MFVLLALKASTYTGELGHGFAIGGETTGRYLLTSTARIELDLDKNGFGDLFNEGLRATLTGKFVKVHGVEIKVRSVFVVTKAVLLSDAITKPYASVVTSNATSVTVENHGGGFMPPPPAGSACTPSQEKYALELHTGLLTWTQCEASAPGAKFTKRSSERTLSDAELAKAKKDLTVLKVAVAGPCGADKPWETASVTTPAGTYEYKDSFYSCQGKGTFIDGLGEALSALRALAKLAGEALAAVRGATPIDALVMASAAQRGDVVYTADVGDLENLAGYFRAVRVIGIG